MQPVKRDWPGKLIVVEGSDYSGHTTQSGRLKSWLEQQGYAVYEAGIKRSALMRQAIDEAKEEHVLGRTTMALLYATDFADACENGILPALRAGLIVVADRYVYTLMARQLVREAEEDWLTSLYSFALPPDLVFYLSVPAESLMHRCFQTYGRLSYWEAGMDLALSESLFDSFLLYQQKLIEQYERFAREYNFHVVDGGQPIDGIQALLRETTKNTLELTAWHERSALSISDPTHRG